MQVAQESVLLQLLRGGGRCGIMRSRSAARRHERLVCLTRLKTDLCHMSKLYTHAMKAVAAKAFATRTLFVCVHVGGGAAAGRRDRRDGVAAAAALRCSKLPRAVSVRWRNGTRTGNGKSAAKPSRF